MKHIYIILLIAFPAFAGSAGDTANDESRYIIDMPNAGIVQKDNVSVLANAYTEGGVMLELTIGLFERFNMGISYSATNIIGSGEPAGPDYPGVHIKYRVIEERESIPAFAFGISTQGRGEWQRDQNRYQTLSPGVYLASSKNFQWVLGNLATHAGFNYSLEPEAENRSVNFYFGLEQSISDTFAMIFEFNSTLDDLETEVNDSFGLANVAIRWSVTQKLTMELQFRDLLGTQDNVPDLARYLTIDYSIPF